MNQSISWSGQWHQEAGLIYISFPTSTVRLLSLFEARMWTIVSVYHCVCTHKNATVCLICSCLTCLAPHPRKWIISCSGSSQGGLCEPLFWHTLIYQTSFPFFLFPSFLPSLLSTPWASRLIYLLDIWHDLSKKSKHVLSKGRVLEIHWTGLFFFQLLTSGFILKGCKIHGCEWYALNPCDFYYQGSLGPRT